MVARLQASCCRVVFNRELNNMGIWYRMGNVPRTLDSSQTPLANNTQNTTNTTTASTPTPAAPMLKYDWLISDRLY